jgi:hypothetical protein
LWTVAAEGVCWGQQGYSIQHGKVLIDAKEHWAQWQSAAETIQITDEGVKPAFVRKSTIVEVDGEEVIVPGINAVLNASKFAGGVREAGSNFSSAANLMDGRMHTFWEPESTDPIRDWWVQLDLGRAVSAQKIVLKFVGEDLGDPFLQFRVTTSQGEQTVGPFLTRTRFRTDKPVKNERVFEVDLSAQRPTKWPNVRGDFTGDLFRYVGVSVTDSDYGKAREVSQADYGRLAPDQQGDIEYFRRDGSGKVKLLTGKEDWDGLEGTDRQGPVVYYRRELPRLAEVEVWSIGDNVAIGTLARGGRLTSWENNGAEGVVVDGDLYSPENALYWPAQGGYNPDKILPGEPPDVERSLIVDLAGSYFLDNIRVIQTPHISSWTGPFRSYRIQLSDGSTNAGGSLAWKTVGSLDNIDEDERYHDFKFPLAKVEHFAYTYRLYEGSDSYALAELQFFGEGYMPESRIASVFEGPSAFIELGNTAQNLASIEWDADTPPATSIILQTRTGNAVKTITHYYKKNGEEYPGTDEEAAKAHATDKKFFGDAAVGPVVAETIPGSDWSGWSQPYLNSGERIRSPSPRKYASIQATFLTDSPLVAATLRSITLNFVTPVARTVIGEVLPSRLEEIGTKRQFSYFIRSTFESSSRGFDDILIEAPAGVEMKFKQVHVDLPGQETATYTVQSEGFEMVTEDSDSLWMHLPAPIKTTTGSALIEVQFEATIFDFSTFFNGSTSHSSFENSWQRVEDGDANGATDSEQTVVLALEKGEVLGNIEVASAIITPNGDGINDEIAVGFSLMRVGTSVPLQVRIYDLSGRLVRQLRDESISTGRHTVVWTGVDQSGALVPPGIYLLRIDIDVNSDSSTGTLVDRLVHVVY